MLLSYRDSVTVLPWQCRSAGWQWRWKCYSFIFSPKMNWQQLVENENLLGIVRKNIKSNISLLRIFRKKSMQILCVKHLANMTNFPVSPPQTTIEIEFGSRSFFVNILLVYTHKRFLHWIYLQMLGRLGWNMFFFCENSKCRFHRTEIKPLYNVCKKGFLVYSICMYFTARMT